MAIAPVQQIGGGVNGTSTTIASASTAFTAGNLLVAVVGWSYSTAAATSIDVPSGWTAAGVSLNDGSPNGIARAYYMPNNPGGSQTWTWTITKGSAVLLAAGYTILEFSGVSLTSPVDLTEKQAATGASSSATLDTTAATGTTVAGDLLLHLWMYFRSTAATITANSSSVPTGGWTQATEYGSTGATVNTHAGAQYQVLAGTQASPRGIQSASPNVSNINFLLTLLAAAAGTTLTPSNQAVVITRNTPSLDKAIPPGSQSVAITGHAPSLGKAIPPGSQAVAITGHAPSVAQGIVRSPGSQAVAITLHAPALGGTFRPTAQAVVVTPSKPILAATLVPAAQALVITGHAPTLSVTAAGTTITPGAQSLSLITYAPSLGFAFVPAAAALTVHLHAPTVAGPAGGWSVDPYIRWLQMVNNETQGRYGGEPILPD